MEHHLQEVESALDLVLLMAKKKGIQIHLRLVQLMKYLSGLSLVLSMVNTKVIRLVIPMATMKVSL